MNINVFLYSTSDSITNKVLLDSKNHNDIVITNIDKIDEDLRVFSESLPDIFIFDTTSFPESFQRFITNLQQKELNPCPKIIVLAYSFTITQLSMIYDNSCVLGVVCVVDRNYYFDKIIYHVAQSRIWICQSASETLLKFALSRCLHGYGSNFMLSQREIEVLRLIRDGNSNLQIATTLMLSERTVRFHVSNILSKLDVNNRTAAVVKGIKIGIIET